MEKIIATVCQEYEISDLYVFGSRADEIARMVRSNSVVPSKSEADVDIGLLSEKATPCSPEKRLRFTLGLEDLFRASRVDLVLLPEAEPFLGLDVIRGELLYAKDLDQQARFELFVLRRAADLLPFKQERTRMILEEGAR